MRAFPFDTLRTLSLDERERCDKGRRQPFTAPRGLRVVQHRFIGRSAQMSSRSFVCHRLGHRHCIEVDPGAYEWYMALKITASQ